MENLNNRISALPTELINHISEFISTYTQFKTKLTIDELLELDLVRGCRYWIVKDLIDLEAVVEVEITETNYDFEKKEDIKDRYFTFKYDLSDWGYYEDDGECETDAYFLESDEQIKIFQIGDFKPEKE